MPVSPLRLLLVTFAGWVNREQANVIEYLVEENRVLEQQLGRRRVRLTDDQRRRLAAKGVVLGRKLLSKVATIVTPDTIMCWHGRLIAAKWTYEMRRVGRPGIMKEIRELIARMATDNSSWGYCRIQGELQKLNHRVARSTIAGTLKQNGIRPNPERPMSWRTFLRARASEIVVTHYTLFAIDITTPAVEVLGTTVSPDGAFVAQVTRNLADEVDGFLRGSRYSSVDRDSKFTAQFDAILARAGVTVTRIAYQAPDMNAFAERWVKSVKTECTERMIFFGIESLRRALVEYVAHYNAERPHQGLGNALVGPVGPPVAHGSVQCHERLGGLLQHYHRAA